MSTSGFSPTLTTKTEEQGCKTYNLGTALQIIYVAQFKKLEKNCSYVACLKIILAMC